jgi:hypothetical protein
MEFYSVLKKNKILIHATAWMDLKEKGKKPDVRFNFFVVPGVG